MKKIILLFATATLLASCEGNNDQKAVTPDSQTTEKKMTTPDTPTVENKPAAISAKPDYTKGLNLVSKSDCSTCHKVAEKMIGPTYADIAKKYTGKIGSKDILAQKIINGASGNWGEVPMPPHPGISVYDANAMANYILNVNKQ